MDIKQLSEQQILELLSKGEKIPYYPDISSPHRETAMQTFKDVMDQETKLERALSRGISEQKGFKGSTKIPDIVKELSADMGIETPDIRFKYDPRIMGSADIEKNVLTLNPQGLSGIGREGLIAHELRHLKEGNRQVIQDNPLTWDKSIRKTLYTDSPKTGNDLLDFKLALLQSLEADQAVAKEQGKSLNYFQKLKDRLFPNDKLKYQIDALDAYDFLEKGHFDTSFLKQNLERISKKLPIIGTAATALGVATASNPAEAAVSEGMGYLIPGGIEELGVSDEQKNLDKLYLQKIKKLNERGQNAIKKR